MDTLSQIAKDLFDEPNRLKRIILFVIRLLLTIALTHWFVVTVVGIQLEVDVSKFEWTNPRPSAFTAFVIGICLISGWFLTLWCGELVSMILDYIRAYFFFGRLRKGFKRKKSAPQPEENTSTKPDKNSTNTYVFDTKHGFLLGFGVIKIEGSNLLPGENFHFLELFYKPNGKKKLHLLDQDIRNSWAAHLSSFLNAAAIFYWIGVFGIQPLGIGTAITILALALSTAIWGLGRLRAMFADFVIKNPLLLRQLESHEWTVTALKRWGLKQQPSVATDIGFSYSVEYEGEKTCILNFTKDEVPTSGVVQEILEIDLEVASKWVLIHLHPATKKAIKLASNSNGKILLIHAQSEQDVIDGFYKVFQ